MLGRIFQSWALGRQRKEIVNFVEMLRVMDGSEIGLVVAGATHQRHGFSEIGIDLMEPTLMLTVYPGITYELSKRCIKLQKQGRQEDAAPLMVWIHTLRACSSLELRGHGRDMWRELQRGFPYVEDAAESFRMFGGAALEIDDADRFPAGLAPEPE